MPPGLRRKACTSNEFFRKKPFSLASIIDHRLHVLWTLAEHGTATAAAPHLTPSAVARQLRLLARDLEVELLVPQGRRVQLAPAARIVLRHAEGNGKRPAQNSPRRALNSAARCACAASPPRWRPSPLRASPACAKTHPLAEPRIIEEESVDCYRLLLADEADIALVLPGPGAPSATDSRFEQTPLTTDRQDLLVAATHLLARRKGIELAEAADQPWIVKKHNNDTYPLVTAACAAGFMPRIVHGAKEWYAVSALVAEALGVCPMPRIVPLPEHAVKRIPLRGKSIPTRQLLTAVRRGSSGHPLVSAGLAALRDIASTGEALPVPVSPGTPRRP
ncbi:MULTISPECIES: LysR family transcriptional regulator [Amycolatopsis]|uniref:LysR family transcriptional regulator n=1 Tax=Amycolatopsis TaxID=1813 RepID=UPI0007E00A71|nr:MULTISPECIES: LysR family transcriptional regulator [Amycolatopsis]OAP21514.1 HTH-type transcriptional regulator CynR [Amycolatopsis sp. M39]